MLLAFIRLQVLKFKQMLEFDVDLAKTHASHVPEKAIV